MRTLAARSGNDEEARAGRGSIPRVFMKDSSWSGISARTSLASRAMLRTWFPRALTGMVNTCQTGFRVFFTTSVLWQIVNLHRQEEGRAVAARREEGERGEEELRERGG
ncbi:hypothetical protein CRUP_034301 [Coryphaenoides rupestris]|nr:hypothetical protein CRUP_034301 [Coryphaenoides rupestris]